MLQVMKALLSRRNVALFGATIVSVIYGITFTIAKDVMPQYIDAYGFILLRVSGAMFLFCCLGCLCRRKNSS
jgi:hypothetical protein